MNWSRCSHLHWPAGVGSCSCIMDRLSSQVCAAPWEFLQSCWFISPSHLNVCFCRNNGIVRENIALVTKAWSYIQLLIPLSWIFMWKPPSLPADGWLWFLISCFSYVFCMTFRNSMSDSINELTRKSDTWNFQGDRGGFENSSWYNHYLRENLQLCIWTVYLLTVSTIDSQN